MGTAVDLGVNYDNHYIASEDILAVDTMLKNPI